jgi:hypothetical protein
MRHLPSLATIFFVGLASQANAEARCPELTQLRGDAAEALKQARTVPTTAQQCEAYKRFSLAWGGIVRYASEHRDSCAVSDRALNDFKRYQREAEKARENVCLGRPARPFPPDIIQR